MGKPIIAVTNRHLCQRPFTEQIERICRRHPRAVLLREKDLTEEEYSRLLAEVKEICNYYTVCCIPHTYREVAWQQGFSSIHLPLSVLSACPEDRKRFHTVGVSVHSIREARLAVSYGASYATAGHIFPTDCKPGLAPRGREFLKELCGTVDIPVYAIGGMSDTEECIADMLSCGAAGICIMSECMQW